MKKYYALSYTFYAVYPQLNHYFITEIDENNNKISFAISSHAEAMRYLRLLEKKLGQVASLVCNPYTNDVCRKELWGWVRE